AGDGARRARLSSYGFFCSLGVTPIEQFHGLSCTVILLPAAATMASRSAGVKLRNWIMTRSPRTAATCAEALGMKIARKPSRYGLPLSQYSGFFLPTQSDPRTYPTNLTGPVPITFFSYQCGSLARISAL